MFNFSFVLYKLFYVIIQLWPHLIFNVKFQFCFIVFLVAFLIHGLLFSGSISSRSGWISNSHRFSCSTACFTISASIIVSSLLLAKFLFLYFFWENFPLFLTFNLLSQVLLYSPAFLLLLVSPVPARHSPLHNRKIVERDPLCVTRKRKGAVPL